MESISEAMQQVGAVHNVGNESSAASTMSNQNLRSSSRAAGNDVAKLPLNISPEKLANGLGWFSIGLGLAELLAPRAVSKIAGAKGDHTGLTRFYGLREIGSGLAIFAQPKSAAAVWSRVAGDAVDLATLGASFASAETKKGRAAFATISVLGVTALDILCAQQLGRQEAGEAGQ